jgi:hypothetical protein
VRFQSRTAQDAPLLRRRAVAAALSIAAACGGDAATDAEFAVRDSAGITIAESAAPLWRSGEGWSIETEPALVLGAGTDSTQQLFEIRDVKRLPTGEILVAQRTNVRLYGTDGVLVRTFGREGRGPGEFSRIGWATACDERVWVGELFAGTVVAFHLDGELDAVHPDVVPAAPNRPQSLAGCLAGRPLISYRDAATRSAVEPPAAFSVRRDSFRLAVIDGGTASPLTTIPGHEDIDGLQRPFGRRTLVATSDSLLVIADNGRYEFELRDTTATLRRIIRITAPALPVTEADRRQIRQQYFEGIPESIVREIEPRFNAVPFHETMPFFSEIRLSADGILWVRAYWPFRTGELARWTAIDARGRWLGPVEFPPGLRVFDIGPDWVLGVWLDASDVEYVRLHRIRRTGDASGSDRTGE